MKKVSALLAAALLTTGTVAVAQADSEGREDAQQEKRICKNQKITGSLTRVRRTCLTQREWDGLAENTRRSVNGLERDANQTQAVGASSTYTNPVPASGTVAF